jgi:nucleoid-associated protein YgaU
MLMRKEVRLGLAIGGVLLAVVIVYILAVTAGPDTPQTVALEQPPQAQGPSQPPVSDPPAPAQRDPFETSQSAGDNRRPASQGAVAGTDTWSEALATGRVPERVPLLLTTTTPDPTVTVAPVPAEANQPAVPGSAGSLNTSVPIAASNVGDAIGSGGFNAPPSTRPSDPTQPLARTHTVREGESFATIAAAAYGNASYYPHLIRANPSLDPRKLRPGMTINLPPVNEVRVDNTPRPAAASAPPTPLDSRTEYRVSNGDSLERISLRLYGKRDRVDKLYELNKSTIGPDPARLKVGTVLKLPEPPTTR